MNCCCNSRETMDLKIEGDVGADPVWCNKCGCNLDIEEVPISNKLAEELSYWARNYGKWIDWNKDELFSNGIKQEDKFNQMGLALTEKVKQEMDSKYNIKFIPSTSARYYAKK